MFGLKFDHTEARYPIDSNERRFDVVDFEGILTRTGKTGLTQLVSLDVTIPALGGKILVMAHADFEKENAVEFSSATCFIELLQTQEEIDNEDPPHPTIEHHVSAGTTRTVPFSAHNLTLVAGFTVANTLEVTRPVTFVGKSSRLHRGWVRNPQLTVLFSDDTLTP